MNLIMTGQTSQVWEVVHEQTRERYALKMLLSDFRKNREQLGYLKHEFSVGKSLKHPQLIKTHELLHDAGAYYLLMEYFPYPNMKVWIRRGYDQIAHLAPKIIQEAAEALGYMNDQGWIHRDVKPENFLLAPSGEVRLIDFALAEKKKSGLAKFFGGRSKIQGTRSYMSPEQIRGETLDHRADMYSFGCTIYELMVGKPPFAGVDSDGLLRKHLRAPPPSIEAHNSNVTAEFSELVRRLLAKKPEDRPESLDKFLREFKKLRVFKVAPRTAATENAG
jgi:serine/threonine protein kinase